MDLQPYFSTSQVYGRVNISGFTSTDAISTKPCSLDMGRKPPKRQMADVRGKTTGHLQARPPQRETHYKTLVGGCKGFFLAARRPDDGRIPPEECLPVLQRCIGARIVIERL